MKVVKNLSDQALSLQVQLSPVYAYTRQLYPRGTVELTDEEYFTVETFLSGFIARREVTVTHVDDQNVDTREEVLSILGDIGVATSGTNIGSGAGEVFKQRVGAEFEFRSILAGDRVQVTTAGDDVLIVADHQVTQTINSGSTATAPSEDAVFDALSGKSDVTHTHPSTDITDFTAAARAAAVADAIVNGVSTIAPSQNAVFDALATKSDVGHAHVAADITDFTTATQTAVVSQVITNGVTTKAPSEDAVFDALAVKVDTDDDRLFIQNLIRVKKNPGIGEFSSVKDAVDSITTASAVNPFQIVVGPGVYIEDTITMKSFVQVVGTNVFDCIIQVDSTAKDVVVATGSSGLTNLTLRGATGAGKAAVVFNNSGVLPTFFLRNVRFESSNILVNLEAGTTTAVLDAAQLSAGIADFEIGFKVSSTTAPSVLIVDNTAMRLMGPSLDHLFEASGPLSTVSIGNVGFERSGTGHAVHIEDGASIVVRGASFTNFGTGLHAPNTGAAPFVDAANVILESATADLLIEHPGTTGYFTGAADSAKVTIDASSMMVVQYTDTSGASTGIVTVGSVFQGDRHDRLLNVSKLTRESATLGVYSGGDITLVSGLDISISAGSGVVEDSIDLYTKELTWTTTPLTLSAFSSSYIFISNSGVVSMSSSRPDTLKNVMLGRVATDLTGILFIERSAISLLHMPDRIEDFQRETFGAIFSSGSATSESGTRNLDVTLGVYYYGNTRFTPAGGSPISWSALYRDGVGGWIVTPQSTVDNAFYDNNSGTLVAIPAGQFTRHSLYLVGEGADETYLLVYGQTTYSTQIAAETASIPSAPNFIKDGVVPIASIIVEEGVAALASIIDIRPRLGFSVAAAATSADHSALSNLNVDSHLQYLNINGVRAMTGNLDMGTNAIVNVGLVDGVDVSTHGGRHNPDGSDPVATGTPVSVGTANSAGNTNSVARSNHVHAHGAQTDPAQHAVATGSVNGFLSAADKTKLDTVATGATANQTDAFLLARANHTGTQLASTISDFTAAAQAAVVTQVITNGVTATAPSEDAVFDALATKEPTITATTAADYYRGDKTFVNFAEAAQDAVGGVLVDTSTIDFDYNDGSNTISATVIQAGLTLDNLGGTLGIAKGGSGQVTAEAGYNAFAPTTTKGDVSVHTGTTNARQGVGANDTVFVADSALTNGVKWAQIVNANIAVGAAIAYAKLTLTNSIVNADVAAGAAITYAKLNLANSVVNADIATGAAIVYSKLNLLGAIVNADIATGAAIVYSKLNLTGAIVNADVATGAAIVYTKLSLTNSIVNTDVAAGAAIAYTKLNLTNSIVNADISTSAAIAYSKLNLSLSIVNADVAVGAAIAYAKLNLALSIVNADIAVGAAIAYSKLALTNSVVNADIAAGAAIAYSKLALTNSIVNADIAAGAAIAYSKLNLTGSIVNADVAAAANIARTKLASGTAGYHVINDYTTGVMTEHIGSYYPRRKVELYEEFVGGGTNSVHNYGWVTTTNGAGAGSSQATTFDAGSFGVVVLAGGTANLGRTGILLATGTCFYAGGGAIEYEAYCRVTNLSVVGQSYKIYLGFGDNSAAGDQTDGIYFSYTHGDSGGDWQGNCAVAAAITTRDTAIPPVAGAWTHLRITVNAAGTLVTFFVDGVSGGTISTGIPVAVANASAPLLKIEKTAGGNAQNLEVDYIHIVQTPTTPRE